MVPWLVLKLELVVLFMKFKALDEREYFKRSEKLRAGYWMQAVPLELCA